MKQHVDTITELMLGAAYADERMNGREVEVIREHLRRLLGVPVVPPAHERRLREFRASAFDVDASAAKLQGLAFDEKRQVLELIAAIHDADDVLHVEEDRYLRRVAIGMGLQEDDVRDLVLDVVEIDSLEGLLAG